MATTAFERDEFRAHPEYLMGTVHLRVWRRSEGGAEVLIQKWSLEKKNHPGMLDISAAGSRDKGEEAITSVARETKEEIGPVVDTSLLEFAFSLRKTNVSNVISTVYLYEVESGFVSSFDDGEVDSTRWLSLPAPARLQNFLRHIISSIMARGIMQYCTRVCCAL